MLCPYGRIDRYGNTCNGLSDYTFPFRNVSHDVVSAMSDPSSTRIQHHAALMMETIVGMGFYGDIVRRCITVISVILFIMDAVRYLRYYHTDSAFDNQCVSSSTYR